MSAVDAAFPTILDDPQSGPQWKCAASRGSVRNILKTLCGPVQMTGGPVQMTGSVLERRPFVLDARSVRSLKIRALVLLRRAIRHGAQVLFG